MADPVEPADVKIEAWAVKDEESTESQITITNERGDPIDTFDNSGSTHTGEDQDLPKEQNAADESESTENVPDRQNAADETESMENVSEKQNAADGNSGPGPESAENSYVIDTKFNIPLLVHLKKGDESWSNLDENGEGRSFGDLGRSGLSIMLYPEYTRTLYSYMKFEVHQLGHPIKSIPNTHIGNIVVYLAHVESVSVENPDREGFQHELASLGFTGPIHDSCVLFKVTASKVYLDTNPSGPSSLYGVSDKSATEFKSLRKLLASPAELSFTMLAHSDKLTDLTVTVAVMKNLMKRERNQDPHPLARTWFPHSENALVMAYGHVPRVGTPHMPNELPQQPINRYVDHAHYMVKQLVSSVNEASFASQEAKLCAKNTHEIVILGELQSTVINRQILVLLKPNKDATETFLPVVEEKCTMHICGVKLHEETSVHEIEDQANLFVQKLPQYFSDEAGADHDDSSKEASDGRISDVIHKEHAIRFTVEEIQSLRRDTANEEDMDSYTSRVTKLAKAKLQSPPPPVLDNDSPPSDDKLLAWSAVRHAISIKGLPHFWQVYHVTMPLEPLKDDPSTHQKVDTPLSERKTITTNLIIPPVPDTMAMAEFVASKVQHDNQLLKVVVRRTESDKTIKAECAAINAIHHPPSCDTPPSKQSLAAFEMMLDMAPTLDNNKYVNLIAEKPGIENVIGRMRFKPKVEAEYKDLIETIRDKAGSSDVPKGLLNMANELDAQKQRSLLSLHSICEGVTFLPGVAGCGKTHFLISVVAFAKYGKKGEECPSLYIAPNNQAVDDTAAKLHRVFKELEVENGNEHMDIIRLYGQDREYRRSDLITENLGPEEIEQLDLENADDTARVLACHHMAQISLEVVELQQAKRRCPKNVTLDTYAREYLREHSDEYQELEGAIQKALSSEATPADRNTIRTGVRQLYKDALSNFKGVVCTTPVSSASALAKCFRPDIVFIDEAGRLHETAAMIPIAWYNPKAWVFTGDPKQLQPHHRMLFLKKGQVDPNPFYDTRKVSLLQRACNAGMPKAQLSVNHRQYGTLWNLPALMFYGNDVEPGSEMENHQNDVMALLRQVRSVVDPTNSVPKNKHGRFRVKFRGAIEQKNDTSFGNTSHVGWCLEKAIAITKTEARCIPPRGDEKARVLILCLYAEQVLQYKSRIREMIESGTSRSVFERIDVRTLDSSQGEERDITFVDFVRTEDVGFCDEIHRLCLSLTRSKGCEIILMNESMTYRRGSKRLACILDLVINVVTQVCCEYCGDHQHTTGNCPGPRRCTICKGEQEHPRARCPDTFCHNCQQKGHAMSACDQPRHCFQCGSESHTETTCTEQQRVRCYTCGEIGHTKFTCPLCPGCYTDNGNHAQSCESQGRACHNCALFGHRSNECPKPRATTTCRNCDEVGHMAAACSQLKCKGCKELGHTLRDCPEKTCHFCNEKGHDKRQCPQRTCFRCQQKGHDKKDCQIADVVYCDICNGNHDTKSCTVIVLDANRNVLTGQDAEDARDVAGAFHREFQASQEIGGADGTGQDDSGWGGANTGQDDAGWGGANTGQDDAGWGGANTGQDDAGWGGANTGQEDATTSQQDQMDDTGGAASGATDW